MKITNNQYSSTDSEILQEDERKAKRGHVLTELRETEQVYVSELQTILTVIYFKYKLIYNFQIVNYDL